MMKATTSLRKIFTTDLLAIGILIGLSLILFKEVLFPSGNEIIFGYDLAWLFQPMLRFTFEALADGRFPLWNPALFLGFPHFAEPQLSTFYPPVLLASLLPEATAFAVLYLLHWILTAVGGYTLVRVLGGRWSGALLGGFVLAFSAFNFAHLFAGHLPHLMTIAYLPWLLAGAAWAIKPRSRWGMVAATMVAAVPLALAFLAGYAPFFPFLVTAVTLFMGWAAWLAWRAGQRRDSARIMAQWAALGLFAGLLAAVQLLPTLQFTMLSNRVAGADYEFAASLSLPFWNLLTLIMPDLFGAPVGDIPYWANAPLYAYWEFAYYVGLLPLLFFGLAGPFAEKPWRLWLIWGLAGLVLGLGAFAGVHFLLYQLIPGFGLFRVPARFAYFFVLATAVLTGLLFDKWFDQSQESFVHWLGLLKKLFWVATIVGGAVILITVVWQSAQVDDESLLRLGGVAAQLLRSLILLLASIGALWWGYGRQRWQVTLVVLLLLIIDLWGHGSKLLTTVENETAVGWAMADMALPPNRTAYRVFSDKLPANEGTAYGFHNATGYDDFRTETGLQLAELAKWDARLAALLGVQYYLAGPEADGIPAGVPGWELLTEPAGVSIYGRQDSLPKTFMVQEVVAAVDEADALQRIQDPALDFRQTAVVQVVPDTQCTVEPGEAGQAEVVVYEPDRVVLRAETAVTGWLVLNDLYYPGWRASVSGTEAVIQPTNYGLRGVCVPPGSHEIVFTYEPDILRVGGWITVVALILLLTAMFYLTIDRMRAKTSGVNMRRRFALPATTNDNGYGYTRISTDFFLCSPAFICVPLIKEKSANEMAGLD